MLIMRASLLPKSALLAFFASCSLAELLAATPVTSDPTITPGPKVPIELLRKQNNDRFMGWLSISGEWTSRTCDIGGTYYQSGENWRCCATTNNGCVGPIGCVGGSLIYSLSTGTQTLGTYACTEVYTDPSDFSFTICNTGFMFQNTADSDPLTNVFCGVSSVNWSYFRQRPSEQTSTEPSSTPSSSTSQSSSTSATAPLQTTSQTATPAPKEKSKAWIAGAVVGPIVGLALLGALLWFCLSRRKKDKTASQPQNQPPMQQQPAAPSHYPAPSYPGSPQPNPSGPQYYDPPKQPNMVPFGVASHNSWTPQSPTTQGSQSPQPPQSPYGQGPGQQWQPVQQNQQIYNQPPAQSPPPKTVQAYMADADQQPGVSERPFSAELASGPYQQMPQQQHAPR